MRILLRIAKSQGGLCISQISEQEGMTHHNVAKLCRLLRMHGFITSAKGHTGGYDLAFHPSEINLKDLLNKLGGALYDENYCARFTPENHLCTSSIDCTLRCLWKILQSNIDKVLEKLSLADLIGTPEEVTGNICKVN